MPSLRLQLFGSLLCLGLLYPAVSPAQLPWRVETGHARLAATLGAAMPTAQGVTLSQVEGGSTGYTPVAGSRGQTVVGTGRYDGVSFLIKSGDSTGSFHASEVANQLLGRAGFGGRDGMATGIGPVHCYMVDTWLEEDQLKLTDGLAPLVESSDVVNHSWAGTTADPADFDYYNAILRTTDFMVTRDDYLCVVGVENSAALPPSMALASAYNVISVGLTSGGHAHGLTVAQVDGPGRVKPEMVAPSDFSSYSTALVSGAGGLLRQVANGMTANARNHLTLKAVLLAGATKEEFPNWSRTTTRPLDLTFGAGELNIEHSWRILTAGEQTPNATLPRASHGWQLGGTNVTRDFILQVPAAQAGARLSAVLVWDRSVGDNPGGNFSPVVRTFTNFGLTLEKHVSGTTYTTLDSSQSTVDNLQHVWQPSLLPGNYRLRVTRPNTTAYAVAWRLTPPDNAPQITIASPGPSYSLSATFLIPGQLYRLEKSTDLAAWQPVSSFTATVASQSIHNSAGEAEPRLFYRLVW